MSKYFLNHNSDQLLPCKHKDLAELKVDILIAPVHELGIPATV